MRAKIYFIIVIFMNLQEFIKQYSGKNINPNGTMKLGTFVGDDGKTYGTFQCVALIQWYMQAVWGIEKGTGNANQFVQNLNSNRFDKFRPGAGRIPQVGDIISFNWGKHGHVGIVTSVNSNGFSFLEQNGGGDGSMGFGG